MAAVDLGMETEARGEVEKETEEDETTEGAAVIGTKGEVAGVGTRVASLREIRESTGEALEVARCFQAR